MRACFCSVLTLSLLLVSAPAIGVVLQSVSLSQSSVIGGTKVAGIVTLDVPALGGGVVVRLSSSHPAATVEPAQVTVPAGTTTASFMVNTIPVGGGKDRQRIEPPPDEVRKPASSTDVSILITASPDYGHGSPKTASLIVLAPMLSDFGVFSPVVGSNVTIGVVRLTGPAPQGGIALKIASNNQQLADVPPTVTVPPGASQANFNVRTRSVAAPTQVIMSASRSLTNFIDATLVLNPPGPGLSCSPMDVTGGDEVTCKVGLNAPPVSQGAIALNSSDPATATVPAFVSVDANHYRFIPFSFKTQVSNVSTKLEISASYAGQRFSTPVNVRQHAVLLDVAFVSGEVHVLLSTPPLTALGDPQTATIQCTEHGPVFVHNCPSAVSFQGKEAAFSLTYTYAPCDVPGPCYRRVDVSATYRGVTKSASEEH